MTINEATDQAQWDSFLASQSHSPFLQSWTMGEVYRATGQEPIRLEARDGDSVVGICLGVVVPARRGKHVMVQYGPVLSDPTVLSQLLDELKRVAKERGCTFIRMSPFLPAEDAAKAGWVPPGAISSPLHLLAEHIWYIDLEGKSEEEILKGMRKTTRNLIRRAGREGVTVEKSQDPMGDLPLFLELHEETRKRHHFTPYTDDFFRAQVEYFAPRGECSLYLALYNGEVIASSVHMHAYGETSYHHGASTHKYPKIPASYLLQWTAITDALKRGDRIYNFWGIAPEGTRKHPFKGVTTFKTGFGGQLLELVHSVDVPLSSRYYATRAFEYIRKWRRGF